MELERRYIERRDFPPTRRGYDPDEVDRHLRAIAEAVEALKSSTPQTATLANTAASRVESIVAAAEGSAREIEEKARTEASEIRAQAERDAAEKVNRGAEMVDRLFTRATELQKEIGELLERVGGLKSAVDTIRTDFDEVAPAPPAAKPKRAPSDPALRQPAQARAAAPEPAVAAKPEPASQEQDGGDRKGSSGASEGARLIALNMALSGAPREETARYLRENFNLNEQDDLLDEVYAKAGS
jgi:DivIVA domain-containing protein